MVAEVARLEHDMNRDGLPPMLARDVNFYRDLTRGGDAKAGGERPASGEEKRASGSDKPWWKQSDESGKPKSGGR
jgi:hypothetical protein